MMLLQSLLILAGVQAVFGKSQIYVREMESYESHVLTFAGREYCWIRVWMSN